MCGVKPGSWFTVHLVQGARAAVWPQHAACRIQEEPPYSVLRRPLSFVAWLPGRVAVRACDCGACSLTARDAGRAAKRQSAAPNAGREPEAVPKPPSAPQAGPRRPALAPRLPTAGPTRDDGQLDYE